MSYICVGKFITPTAARDTLTYAREIAETYEHVTMTDMNNLIGNRSEYSDCKYGWTSYGLRLAYVGTLGPDAYSIHMPACDWFSDKKDATTVTEFPTAKPKQAEPEPINVTIPADKPEVIEQIIDTLFNNSEKIKDRPVFITIM